MAEDASMHRSTAGRLYRRFSIIVVASFCFAALLGGYAWHQYRVMAEARARQQEIFQNERTRLQEIIQNGQGYTETVMDMPPGMTSDEFFRACDRSIDERNRLLIALRSLPSAAAFPFLERITSHMKAVNDLVRAKANLMHLLLRWQSMDARDVMARFKAEFYRTRFGGPEQAINWSYEKFVEYTAALATEVNESAVAFEALYYELADQEEIIAAEVRHAGLVFEPELKKFATSNKALVARGKAVAKGLPPAQ